MNNNQHLPKTKTQVIEKLVLAFSEKDYSRLSLRDLFELVDARFIQPSTAARLMDVISERGLV